MIQISSPYITREAGYSFLNVRCSFAIESHILWYRVPIQYEKYLTSERSDAFFVPLTVLAMLRGENISFEKETDFFLFRSFVSVLIPCLAGKMPEEFHRIEVAGPTTVNPLPTQGWSGTGVSCGVDSLDVISSLQKGKTPDQFVLKALVLLPILSYQENNAFPTVNEREHKQRSKISQAFCQENGYQFLDIKSNIHTVLPNPSRKNIIYWIAGHILALQKLFGFYHIASSYPVQMFKVGPATEYYADWLAPLLSTASLRFFIHSSSCPRQEKMANLVSYLPARKYLNPCLYDVKNCNRCSKCIRTLLALDILNATHDFSEAFDIPFFEAHKEQYIARLPVLAKRDVFLQEIWECYKKKGYRLTWRQYLYVGKFWLELNVLRPAAKMLLPAKAFNKLKNWWKTHNG